LVARTAAKCNDNNLPFRTSDCSMSERRRIQQ
jgi:hypothetical protein